MVFVAGQDLTAAELNGATDGTWTSYTPTWRGLTTNPALGNGTLSGAWSKLGRTRTVRINLLPGSTTTYGTGSWAFDLPAAAAVVNGFTGFPIWLGDAYGFEAGVANRFGVSRVLSGESVLTITDDSASRWDATTPHTWAFSDMLAIQITYETAA